MSKFHKSTLCTFPTSPTPPTSRRTGALLLTLLFLAPAALSQRQDLEVLRSDVAEFLQQHYAKTNAERVEIDVNQLDPRLHLADCGADLTFNVTDHQNFGGAVSVHAQCQGSQPWALYIPAQVDLFRPVAVAGHNLGRGAVISKVDIKMVLKNTSHLRQGFVDRPEKALGLELRRPIKRGEAFRAGILIEPLAVKRGDEVRLLAFSGAIRVSARGTAMGSGRVGEQIRVKNNNSSRIVKGEITAAGQVKIHL